jgi:hypothetical protein
LSTHLQVSRLVGMVRRVLRASAVQVWLWGSGELLILMVGKERCCGCGGGRMRDVVDGE